MSRLCAFLLLSCTLMAYSSEDGTNTTFTDYQQEGLKVHNSFRAIHDSQPMRLNKTLTALATKNAQDLSRYKDPIKANLPKRGVNFFVRCFDTSIIPKIVTKAVTEWYNEVCFPGYDFNKVNQYFERDGFTQVVWNVSTELGIGKADSVENGMKCTYIVVLYKPHGIVSIIDEVGPSHQRKANMNVKQGNFNRAAYCNSVDYKERDNFQREAIDVHNKLRAIHGSQPIRMDKDLSVWAAGTVRSIANIRNLEYREKQSQRSNVFIGCSKMPVSPQVAAKEAVTQWYNEVCLYGYEFGFGPTDPSRFARLVWNSNTKLGIAKVESVENGRHCTFIVARYERPMNHTQYYKNIKQGGLLDREEYCGCVHDDKNKTQLIEIF